MLHPMNMQYTFTNVSSLRKQAGVKHYHTCYHIYTGWYNFREHSSLNLSLIFTQLLQLCEVHATVETGYSERGWQQLPIRCWTLYMQWGWCPGQSSNKIFADVKCMYWYQSQRASWHWPPHTRSASLRNKLASTYTCTGQLLCYYTCEQGDQLSVVNPGECNKMDG